MKARSPLLKRALAQPATRQGVRQPPTREEIEIALMWMRGELTLPQVMAAYYPDAPTTSGRALYRCAVCLRAAYQQGLLQSAAA